jgi:acetylornithine deacetylase/succinyl-diaminopimelate desuccinylase-like protein
MVRNNARYCRAHKLNQPNDPHSIPPHGAVKLRVPANDARADSSMLDRVLAAADANFEAHVARLQRFIRQPSVSAEARGNDEMAAMLVDEIRAFGGSAQSVPGVDFPIVYGRIDSGAARTVLIHSMYDTTPAAESSWVVPPFDAVRMDFESYGECIIARGAEDTKGPVSAVFAMLDSYKCANVPLPVNLILLFEASELGSASLPPFVRAHREELRRADVTYWPWHTQRQDGTGVVWLGCKGIVTFKLRVRAGDWGGPTRAEIHGLHSAWIANPTHRLIAALASLKTDSDLDVSIEGFYGAGDPITAEDEALVAVLARRLDPNIILHEVGARRFKQDTFLDALRAHIFQSEFNVSGIAAGHVINDGHKVTIPSEAVASLDLRPLDGMSVEQVMASLRNHLDRQGFPEVAIELNSGYLGGRMSVNHWAVGELIGAYRDVGLDPEIWPRTATAIAVSLFTQELGIPWIGTCPGHASRKHSANEFVQLSTYRIAVEFMCRLMLRLGHAVVPRDP